MPNPIDHRDVTLTDGGRQKNHEQFVTVHLDTVSVATDVTCALYTTLVADQSDKDITRHELRLLLRDIPAASVFWDSEMRWQETSQSDNSSKTVTKNMVPNASGSVAATRPSTVPDGWTSLLEGGWDFDLFVWKTNAALTVTLTETAGPSGKTWTITAKNSAGAVKYSGYLGATYSLITSFMMGSLSEKMRRKIERIERELEGAVPSAKKAARKSKKAESPKKPRKKTKARVS